MSFFSRKAVRESLSEAAIDDVGLDIVDVETDVDAALLEVENDTQEIANADIEASIMDEDVAETEDRLEALDVEDEESAEDITEGEMEQIDVAQESIRGRWGFRHRSVARESLGSTKTRRVVAREGLWDDIKAFFRRMREWLEERIAALKDRWIKFHNAGKTIQKKSKKYDALINKLGQKDKDTIKGSWIEYGTVNGSWKIDELKFENISKSTEMLSDLAAIQKTVADEAAKASAAKPAQEAAKTKTKAEKEAEAKAAKEAEEKAKKEAEAVVARAVRSISQHQPGNRYFGLSKDDENTVVFEKIEDANVPDEINTPSVSDLKTANTQYNRFGIDLEKHLQAWRKNEKSREDVTKSLKKAEDALDKVEVDNVSSVVSAHRTTISMIRGQMNKIDELQAHLIKCATLGLGGFLTSGIQAYKKAKS